MINARKDVSRVPIRKGNAPYTSFTGSQVDPTKYLNPNDLIEGIDSMINVSIIPNTNISMSNATMVNERLKKFSIRICPFELLAFLTFIVVVPLYTELPAA